MYAGASIAVRDDLCAAHADAWRSFGAPGTWLTGAERAAVVRAVRHAYSCAVCAARKQALSPYAVAGEHDADGEVLPAALIDVVHRVVTDAGRLSQRWFDEAAAASSDAHVIEVIGVTVRTVCIDSFCRGLGVDLHPAPDPEPGEPTRTRPERARMEGAWVAMVPKRGLPNVARALSLVPAEARAVVPLVAAQYVPVEKVADYRFEGGRAIGRAQIELVASRVSAINECFY